MYQTCCVPYITYLKNTPLVVFIEQLQLWRPGNNKKAQCFQGQINGHVTQFDWRPSVRRQWQPEERE